MNSGTTSTELNDMLTNFVDYVYSFYGADDALYPMGVTKSDIYGARSEERRVGQECGSRSSPYH